MSQDHTGSGVISVSRKWLKHGSEDGMDKLGHPDRFKDGNKVTRKKVKMRESRGRERTRFKRAENTQERKGQVNSWTSMCYFACFSSLTLCMAL